MLNFENTEIPEEVQKQLNEQVAGLVSSKVEEETTGMRSKLDELLSEAKTAKQKAKEAEEAKARAAEEAARTNGDIESLDKSWSEKLSAKESEYQSQIETLMSTVRQDKVETVAVKLAAELSGEYSDAMLPHVLSRLDVEMADGYVLSAVLDSRTSDICLGWNGTVILWTENYQPKPPFHFNCRTTMIPYFVGGTEIPAGGFDWLKRQSAQFQNDLIGPTRGDLLRNSGLTADEYRRASRNNLNEPITLEEMARKNKEIADRLKQTKTGV